MLFSIGTKIFYGNITADKVPSKTNSILLRSIKRMCFYIGNYIMFVWNFCETKNPLHIYYIQWIICVYWNIYIYIWNTISIEIALLRFESYNMQ